MGRVHFWIFTLFTFSIVPLYGQFGRLKLKQLSQDQNLPGVTVRQLFHDSKGILWVGVESYGLCRYDGYDFELFSHQSEDSNFISNNVVEALCEDNNGDIWAGTQYGLNVFHRSSKSFTTFYAGNAQEGGLPSNTVLSLCHAADYIWIGTSNGLARYCESDSSLMHISLADSSQVSIYKIIESPNHNLWIGTNKGVFHIDTTGRVILHLNSHNSSIPEDDVHSLCLLSDSSLLVGSGMHLFRYRISDNVWWPIRFLIKANASSGDYIIDIVQDDKSNVWVGTTTDGLSILPADLHTYTNFTPSPDDERGLKSTGVRDILQDNNGLVWLGLKFQGIQFFSYQSQQFKHYYQEGSQPTDLSNKNIISIAEVSTGDIWLGTGKGGINVFDTINQTFRHVTSDKYRDLNTARINTIRQSVDGKVWVGTSAQVYRTDAKAQKFERVFATDCIDLLVDSSAVWMGTVSGLKIYTDGRVVTLAEFSGNEDADISKSIKCLFRDSRRNVWIGTLNSGLYRYDEQSKKLTSYVLDCQDNNCISGNHIRCITEDKEGVIWIATRGQGLNKYSYSDSTFTVFNERHGLPTNTLFGLLVDDLDCLWISSYQGLSCFDTKNASAQNFTKEYGLQNDIFEPNARCKSSTGVFYFGGDNGFNCFLPSKININSQSYPLVLTSMKAFDEELFTDLNSDTTISLRYDQNFLSFEFSLLDYTGNLGKQYSYILEGFDTQWQHTRNRHYASYTNIGPGNYVFKLRAESKDGTASSNYIVLEIEIRPPFWKTLWFRILFGIVSIAIIYALVTYRLYQEKRRSKMLEHMVNEKTEHLRKQKQELILQNQLVEDTAASLEHKNLELQKANTTKNTLISVIAHDMKNQFASILSISSLLLSPRSTGMYETYAHQIGKATKAVNDTLENLLYWYKSQHTELRPQIISVNVFEIAQLVADNYSLAALDKKIELKLMLAQDAVVLADKEMFTTIIRNLVNNAIKHSKNTSNITISGQLQNGHFAVTVADTGEGMPQDILETLFMPRSYTGGDSVSNGLGLQICKRFADAMGVELLVQSELGHGTKFTLELTPASADMNGAVVEYSPRPFEFEEAASDEDDVCRILRNKRILLIDDNVQLLGHLKQLLSDFAKITLAQNGTEGLLAAESQLPDLIVTDLMMPGMNGIELTESLRSNPQTQHIPIILLTGQNFDSVQERAVSAGVTDFIAKPFDANRFILKIKNIFQLQEAIHYNAQVSTASSGVQKYFLDTVIETIKEQTDYSNFSVETLADMLCMSKSTLIRKLKNETDKSPSELLNDIRFSKSKALLDSNKYSVSEIAWMMGFNESKYFSKKFKEKYGMSPRDYAKGFD